MHYWFQNLKKEDKEKRWFHFRGSVGSSWKRLWFRYELASGPALRLTYSPSEEGHSFSIGLLFFTVYLTLPGKAFPGTFEREYGFYFHQWAFVWHFHKKRWESNSSDPWWQDAYIHLDEWVFGKMEILHDYIVEVEDVYFELGGKEFKMDSIKWERWRRFRRFIPYILWHQADYRVDMKISKPPLHAGKGENSWDCDDDGSFGMSASWSWGVPPAPTRAVPSWLTRELITEQAVQMYVESVLKDTRKYGGAGGEHGINRDAKYVYIGFKKNEPAAI